jgi:RNA recognition motif-containing protein
LHPIPKAPILVHPYVALSSFRPSFVIPWHLIYSQAPPLAALRADASSNFNLTGPDLYEVFGKYGPIRQIRLGNNSDLKTKGTAYIVFESPDDAREAQTHLNGFHLMERYIVGE